LNLAFFSILLLWVWTSSSSAFIYEEAYAKEIAFIIDGSKPGMKIELDLSEGLLKSREAGIPDDQVIQINNEKNEVLVRLSDRGFKYNYFTNYNVTYFIGVENKLVLFVNEDV
jgi:chorismate synthase